MDLAADLVIVDDCMDQVQEAPRAEVGCPKTFHLDGILSEEPKVGTSGNINVGVQGFAAGKANLGRQLAKQAKRQRLKEMALEKGDDFATVLVAKAKAQVHAPVQHLEGLTAHAGAGIDLLAVVGTATKEAAPPDATSILGEVGYAALAEEGRWPALPDWLLRSSNEPAEADTPDKPDKPTVETRLVEQCEPSERGESTGVGEMPAVVPVVCAICRSLASRSMVVPIRCYLCRPAGTVAGDAYFDGHAIRRR